jgi:hypothetical protein
MDTRNWLARAGLRQLVAATGGALVWRLTATLRITPP